MALDAGEVFVVCGAKLDSASIARSRAAMKSLADSSNDYQKAITRGEEASNKLHASNQRWQRAAVVGAKGAAIGIGAVTAALAGAAVAAASFDASMRNVNSIAGLSEKNFKALEQRVLGLSTAVGKSPKELADGLYSIVSSGFKAQDAMKILTAGARAARAGLTDTATATTALTSVLNAYGLKAGDARKVSDVLFQTVNTGVLNFEQLSGALGKVLSPAASIGVSLTDLSGALAALTLRGNSADEAATQLGQTMLALQKPGPALSKVLKGLGYESGTAAIKAVGFKGSLDAIVAAANKAGIPLAQLFSNVRALRGVQGLEGTAHAAAVFTSSVKAMNDATKGAGETAKVYAEQQKSTAAQFDHLKAAVDVAAVTIGAALLPQINAGIQALTKWFAAAQKSGDLTRWAHEIASGVSDVVTFLHSLGPAASAAFHTISSTIQAALPFVRELYRLFLLVEPAIADVAHAATGLAGALGPAPILAAAAAFLTLRRATLTGQVALGTFAKVMAAGNLAIAGSATGGVDAAGKITKIGAAATESAGGVRVFARGLVGSIGKGNLIAAGVAGIVGGILLINSTLSDTKQEAEDAVRALKDVFDARLALKDAGNDIAQAQLNVEKTRAALPSAAVRVRNARDEVAATQGHPGIVDPAAEAKLTARLRDQRQAIIDARRAQDELTAAQEKGAKAQGHLGDTATNLRKQLGGLTHSALTSAPAQKITTQTAPGGGLLGTTRTVDLQVAARQAEKLFDQIIRKSDDLTAAQKRTGLAVGALFNTVGRPPKPAELKIIADDLAAGKSIKAIIKDLGWVAKAHPKPTIDANKGPFDAKADDVTRRAAAIDRLHPKVHLGASGFSAVNAAIDGVNSNILRLTSKPFTVNVQYATGKAPPLSFGAKGHWVGNKWVPNAAGSKVTKPTLSLSGEDGDEYIIPVSQKHKASGMALWLAAGRDLGIPGYAKGKKPGKTPAPIQHGLGYDPSALDAQESAEKSRLDQARSYRDTLNTRLGTDHKHHDSVEKQLETAQRGTKSKNPATRAAAQKRVTSLMAEIKRTDEKIAGEQAARDRQRDAVIPRDVKRYESAVRAARVGNQHASQITLWQDRADADTTAMATASAQWDAADRKKDGPGKKKAYDAWVAAQTGRKGALDHVKALLQEVAKVVGKTDYGAKIQGQLAGVIGDIVQATDESQAPGYEDPTAAQEASTSIDDYLYPEERAALAQAALDEARAAATEDTADDVTAASAALGVANWIGNRLQIDGAPVDILTQAYQAIASARSDLTNAIQGNTPSGASGGGVTADQQAVLDQQKSIASAAAARADSSEAALRVFQQSGDLFRGQQSVSVYVSAMSAGDPQVQRQIGSELAKAFGSQNAVPATTGFYDG